MFTHTISYGINGLDAFPVTIETYVSKGLPTTIIVGLPDNAIKESKERVRAAIKNSGYIYPADRITINLSPADIKKEGPAFDLAIALNILNASEQTSFTSKKKYVFLGELSLDGKLQPIRGALAVALSISSQQFDGIIVPIANAQEAAMAKTLPVYAVENLSQAVHFLQKPNSIDKTIYQEPITISQYESIDFSDVKGQQHVKRGLEIAAAGGHNALMIGPPGSGKSMLAKRLPTILPDMTRQEILETTKIYSIMNMLPKNNRMMTARPFRSPHHTTSAAAIVGGGSHPRPGEITLSHNGILFLDELPEFNRHVLESLRQPLEDQQVTVSRASRSLSFPCRFLMICAMNPTKSGEYNSATQLFEAQQYLSKLSGPLLDRIDLHLDVPQLSSKELFHQQSSESSASIKERTTAARTVQQKRFNQHVPCNAFMTGQDIKKYCSLKKESQELLQRAIEELNLSARAYDKILKVARTIADLDHQDNIETAHIAEAIGYRQLDRQWFG